ncbi:MAG: dimethyl sulfoxide reductase anchor subunit [Pseudolabrys sp.]
MHPAVSVIFFTTATGAGYGLLALLGVGAALGLLPPHLALGLTGLGLAITLISAGLLSSTAHLGHPERAWRALSQWRSSWLSREGVAAIFTYLPAAAFAVGWIVLGRLNGWVAAAGVLAALGALVTVAMTGMIYASLKPVAQWHTTFTLPAYLIFAAITGLTLLNAILQAFGLWRHDAGMANGPTLNSATGLTGGTVRSVQWPHSERNYLLKEMGYRIARKHSVRLRHIAQVLAFAVPLALFVAAFFAAPWAAVAFCVLAVPVQLAGMLIERWLFFAEATHTVTLYYGLP